MRLRRRNGAPDDESMAADPQATDHHGTDDAAAADDQSQQSSGGPPSRRKGWMQSLMADHVAASREEAEKDAARELREFMAPAMDQLVLNVPGSTSAEEAGATLARQSAVELQKPVEVRPETVIDLRNPPEMRAYPPEEKLSNRVLRLANRHWAENKPRPSAEIVAEKSAIADEDFARKPIGTQRCLVFHGSLRCRGVFAFNAEEQSSTVMRCPMCQAAHVWDEPEAKWTVIDVREVSRAPRKGALSAKS